MIDDFTFKIRKLPFDEDYRPSDNTRITTNFANLARGENRRENLRSTFAMINARCNQLANWDNSDADRYSIALDIISVEMSIEGSERSFPIIEMLKTSLYDRKTNEHIEGLVGNNFSSYVRDYDFSIILRDHNKNRDQFNVPDDFGDLHGNIFKEFIRSDAYKAHFSKSPVICLSVSDNKTYHQTSNYHPILGIEYLPNETSLTEQYFKKMGLQIRYFMPPNSVAPLAFYFTGDLLIDYTNLELISTISTMETFQKIYRPEIYNAHCQAGQSFKPSLKHGDYSPTPILYDREERNQLAVSQGKFAEDYFIKPYQNILNSWSAQFAA